MGKYRKKPVEVEALQWDGTEEGASRKRKRLRLGRTRWSGSGWCER